MSKRKKIIVLSCMIALLAVTAVFNFVLSGQTTANDTVTTATYFSQYRTQRTSLRNEQILQLDKIIEESEEDSQARNDALEQKIQLTAALEQEFLLESLIKACGFTDAIVKINLTSSNVNVIIDRECTQDEAIKIFNVVNEEMNISPENCYIMHI